MNSELAKTALTSKWYGGEWIVERRLMRLFYRFKALVCILFDREYQPQAVQGISWGYQMYYDWFIPIVVLDGGMSPGNDHHLTTYWHDELAVGHSVFRHWFYAVNSESSD